MYIDSVRVYQTSKHDAHAGYPHTLGCDPPDYPTKDYIEGHMYRYMRGPPFSYDDTSPLRPVKRGGGHCKEDSDCGGNINSLNLTAVYEGQIASESGRFGRGQCLYNVPTGLFGTELSSRNGECVCNRGFTGPHCLALDHWDNFPSAHKLEAGRSPFESIAEFQLPGIMWVGLTGLLVMLLFILVDSVRVKRLPSDRQNSNIYVDKETQPLLQQKPGHNGSFQANYL